MVALPTPPTTTPAAATEPAGKQWKRRNRALFTDMSPEWYTPSDLLAEVRAFLGADYFDPCPASGGRLRSNGLSVSWAGERVYCNPPYGRAISAWIRKALTEPVAEVILLVPARTDTAWFQALFQHTICFLRGRLRFSGAVSGAPFPSALVYRGPRFQAFAAAFGHRGPVCVAVRLPVAPTLWNGEA